MCGSKQFGHHQLNDCVINVLTQDLEKFGFFKGGGVVCLCHHHISQSVVLTSLKKGIHPIIYKETNTHLWLFTPPSLWIHAYWLS